MKFSHLGICFTLCMCLEGKDVRQISRLIPVDDWIDFKNRNRDVKPLDKLIGKLRATYDFVFHKPDNVTNVKKILDEASDDGSRNVEAVISNVSLIARRKSTGEKTEKETTKEENPNVAVIEESTKRNESNDWSMKVEDRDTFDRLETFDDSLILERLEIFDSDEGATLGETDNLDEKDSPPHTKFALPYAIAQALLRWIISLYLSTSNHFASIDTGFKETE